MHPDEGNSTGQFQGVELIITYYGVGLSVHTQHIAYSTHASMLEVCTVVHRLSYSSAPEDS